jgi:hypothetical protein
MGEFTEPFAQFYPPDDRCHISCCDDNTAMCGMDLTHLVETLPACSYNEDPVCRDCGSITCPECLEVSKTGCKCNEKEPA